MLLALADRSGDREGEREYVYIRSVPPTAMGLVLYTKASQHISLHCTFHSFRSWELLVILHSMDIM